MDILRLRLNRPLRYCTTEAPMRALAEGEEALIVYAESAIVHGGPEGPRLSETFLPIYWGRAAREGQADHELPAASYAFVQTRLAGEGAIPEALESFARDLWWEGARCQGPWLVRIVGEDGQAAYQFLRAIDTGRKE